MQISCLSYKQITVHKYNIKLSSTVVLRGVLRRIYEDSYRFRSPQELKHAHKDLTPARGWSWRGTARQWGEGASVHSAAWGVHSNFQTTLNQSAHGEYMCYHPHKSKCTNWSWYETKKKKKKACTLLMNIPLVKWCLIVLYVFSSFIYSNAMDLNFFKWNTVHLMLWHGYHRLRGVNCSDGEIDKVC